MDVRETVARMTLREKAELMTGKDFWQTRDFPKLGVRSLFLADGPHGVRKQAAAADHLGLNPSLPATCFPTASAMANSWNTALGEQLGIQLGREAAALGVDVLLGPGVNMKRNPLCGRNFEYFSEDPHLAGKLAAAYIRGIQSQGVAACVKHFAANNQEYRRMVVDAVVDERTLRELYLTAFEIAVREGGSRTLMSSYNKVNGIFANENPHLMRKILREEWGFTGAVITDWGGCNDRVEGARCGSDLEMPACRYGVEDVLQAVETGRLPEAVLDECATRLLELAEVTEKKAAEPFNEEAGRRVAYECALECAVLLENDGTLPLKEGASVAIIGDFAFTPRYQGAGSSIVNPTGVARAAEEAERAGLNLLGCARGFHRSGRRSKRLARKALRLAARADVAVCFLGLNEACEVEGLERPDMKLPENQTALVRSLTAAGRKVVVVLSCGAPVETEGLEGVAAVLYTGLAGQEGARAALDLLTGKAVPTGKLAESWPVLYEDCPTAKYFPGSGVTAEHREGPFIGYRYYSTAGVPVRYPFGHGLSYTEFSYSGLTVTEDGVAFTVTNTGGRAGAEVSQLYVSKPESGVIRPKIELKGFCKTTLAAGESRRVFIPFDEMTFRFYDTDANAWRTEAGKYIVLVGASSENLPLRAEIERGGVTLPARAEGLPSYFSGNVKDVPDEEFRRLLGREIPKSAFLFYRRNRMRVHENTTVADLKYAPGFCGRIFAGAIHLAIGVCRLFRKTTAANTLTMSVQSMPMRGLAKYGGMSRRRMEGLIALFNGRFFRGLAMIFTKGKQKRGGGSV